MRNYYNLTEIVSKWPKTHDGWSIAPDGLDWIYQGYKIWVGNNCFAGKDFLLGNISFIADNFNVGDNFTTEGNFISDADFTAGNDVFIGYGFKTNGIVVLGNRAIIGPYFFSRLHFNAGDDFKAGRDFHSNGKFECGNRFTVPDGFYNYCNFKTDDDFHVNKNSKEIPDLEYLHLTESRETNIFKVNKRYFRFKPSNSFQKTISIIKNVLYELNYIFK